ncbi:hypothetical protein QTO34_001041 [Cnephaeus nilssonii]|uniref:Uncharacterized protein n=1 Tax=Cnephaeus nilssonii TaxID=3371016 RepID=A0AA40HUZ3_CNENI|nr:hypothetical protein QTO34_001041 [Eptesicus nilssonii]
MSHSCSPELGTALQEPAGSNSKYNESQDGAEKHHLKNEILHSFQVKRLDNGPMAPSFLRLWGISRHRKAESCDRAKEEKYTEKRCGNSPEKGYACIFPENFSKPVWIPARNIKLQQGSKRETSQTNEDLAPGVTPCSCRQSTTSATEGSDSKQSTEDEEQEENKPDNKQPGGHLRHGKEDGEDSDCRLAGQAQEGRRPWPGGQASPLTASRVFRQHDELLQDLLPHTVIQRPKEHSQYPDLDPKEISKLSTPFGITPCCRQAQGAGWPNQ